MTKRLILLVGCFRAAREAMWLAVGCQRYSASLFLVRDPSARRSLARGAEGGIGWPKSRPAPTNQLPRPRGRGGSDDLVPPPNVRRRRRGEALPANQCLRHAASSRPASVFGLAKREEVRRRETAAEQSNAIRQLGQTMMGRCQLPQIERG